MSVFSSAYMADVVINNTNSLSLNFRSGVKEDGVLGTGTGAQVKYRFVGKYWEQGGHNVEKVY